MFSDFLQQDDKYRNTEILTVNEEDRLPVRQRWFGWIYLVCSFLP